MSNIECSFDDNCPRAVALRQRVEELEVALKSLVTLLYGSGRLADIGLVTWLEAQDGDFKQDVRQNFVKPGLLKLREIQAVIKLKGIV